MTEDEFRPRSPALMSVEDTALVVIDVQERLLPVIEGAAQVRWNVRRLLDGARMLGVDVVATEQYPQGLGPTVEELARRLDAAPHAKSTFSCLACQSVFEALRQRDVAKVLLCGIESHVCVMQTALDFLADAWHVYVAVDAMSSRHWIDHKMALRRMDSAGVTLTTTEAALFEWCRTSEHPAFKDIGKLVRESAP